MKRRAILGGTGVVAAGVVGGALVSRRSGTSEPPDHALTVENARDDEHEARIEYEFGGETVTLGPETIAPDDRWTPHRFDSDGTVAIEYYVDGDRLWEDTHDVPSTLEGRRSGAQLVLLPDGDRRTDVLAEV